MSDHLPDFYCGSCGALFDIGDVDESQWDDLHCPECGSGDVGGSDDLEHEGEGY